MKKLLVLSFLALIWACSNRNSVEYKPLESASAQKELQPVIMNNCDENSILLSYPRAISNTDKYIIILDPLLKDGMCVVFDKESGEYITSFARKGRGPGEIIGFPTLHSCNNNEFIMHSAMTKQMFTFDLSGDIKNKSIEAKVTTLGILHDKEIYGDLFGITKDKHLATNYAEGHFIGILNKDSLEYSYTNYPIIDKEGTVVPGLFNSTSSFEFNNDKTKLIIGTQIGAILQVFDISKYPFIRTDIRYINKPIFNYITGGVPLQVSHKAESTLGFEDIAIADNNEIYTVYSGHEARIFGKQTIIVFDWDLNLKRKFSITDDYIIRALTVENGIIYAVAQIKGESYKLIKMDVS